MQGKKVGTTNVSLFDENKQLIGVFDVEVAIDARNIAQKIHASTGSPGINVSSSNEQVVLTGEAKTPATPSGPLPSPRPWSRIIPWST